MPWGALALPRFGGAARGYEDRHQLFRFLPQWGKTVR